MTARTPTAERIRKRHNEELRTIAVCARLDNLEASKLDKLRGKIQRGTYIRMLINGITSRKIPTINMQAYNTLLDINNNLDAIAKHKVIDNADVAEIRTLISKLRLELLDVKLE